MIQIFLDMTSSPWSFWILAALISGIFEMILPSFTFAFASFAALLTALIALQFDWITQYISFSVILLVSIPVLRPRLVKRLQKTLDLPSRSESLIGKSGKVSSAINPLVELGRVTIDGEDWAADSSQPIPAGALVQVEGSDGIILIVKEIK